LKSRNGTFLNGKQIDGEVMVADGDQLKIGTLQFAFQIKSEEGAPLPVPIQQGEVQWLLDAPANSPALESSHTATDLPSLSGILKSVTAKSPAEAMSDSTSKKRTKAISAGQHLHDYFDKRKPRPVSVNRKKPAQN
jgi:pSer/pThr/pTyr-binding forkhead associated (FHA) protein